MKTVLVRPFLNMSLGIYPPSSLMYLSSYLKSKKLEVELIDKCVDRQAIRGFSAHNSYMRNLMDDIKTYNPDIIGMTLFSGELKEIAMLCKLLKDTLRRTRIILGGPHPTAMPRETLEQIPECDFVVRGEGELILHELIRSLSGGGDLRKVKGVSYRSKDKDEIFHNEDAPVINDLDALPFPDIDGVIHNYRNGAYISPFYGPPSAILITSRGCPFECRFCFKVCDKYRSRSAENVLKEIEWLMRGISPRGIEILDDTFTVERDRCVKILDALIGKKYPCRFRVRSRVDLVDEELLAKMKEAGIDGIVYGFESGSQELLNAFNKKTTLKQNIAACELTRKAGLDCLGDMMLFYPGETKKTLKETEDFIKRAKPIAAAFYVLTPLPKTRVYNEAKESGRLIGDWGAPGEPSPWIRLDEFKNLEEMERIAQRLFIKTILRPAGIFWLTKLLCKFFIRHPIFSIKLVIYGYFKRKKY